MSNEDTTRLGLPRFDSERGVYRAPHEADDPEALIFDVLQAIADLAGVDQMAIKPLYYTVDVEFLTHLIEARWYSDNYPDATFSVHGYGVRVTDTEVIITPPGLSN